MSSGDPSRQRKCASPLPNTGLPELGILRRQSRINGVSGASLAEECERPLDFCCWTPLRRADRILTGGLSVPSLVRSHWAALNNVQNLFLLNAAQIINQQENTAAYEGFRIKIVFTDIDRVSAAPNGHLT